MNWMFQPGRSKNDIYDEQTNEETSIAWKDIPLLPVYILIFVLAEILESLAILLIPFGFELYKIAKRVSETGRFEFPGLVVTGIATTAVLLMLISNRLFNVADHPVITIGCFLFVLFSSLAPLIGLVWQCFKTNHRE